MEPIISPWIIYIIEIVPSINCFFFFTSLISGLLTTAFTVIGVALLLDGEDEDLKKVRKCFNIFGIIWVISLFFAITIPSKETIYAMIVANNLTYDNVNSGIDAGKEVAQVLREEFHLILNSISK